MSRQLEDLVRIHLDGRPDRWRAVIRLLLSGSPDPVEDLVVAAALRVR
jgi:hypothetical protein